MDKMVLVMTAVEAERDAVLRGLNGDARFEVALAGVGPALAAARTARILAGGSGSFALVVSAGIGGGFAGQADVGSIVVASEIVAADLGAETAEGFAALDELGFGSARVQVEAALAERLQLALEGAGLPVRLGPVLTVSTVTGTASTAAVRAARVSGAAAEGMEGYGVAVASVDHDLPVLEIRAISNAVGPRDRSAWRIKEALGVLEAASAKLPEVFFPS